LDDAPGITDVALGHAELSDALVPVAVKGFPSLEFTSNGRSASSPHGTLQVLGAGSISPAPAGFMLTDALGATISVK
jgi:hypothetical protein